MKQHDSHTVKQPSLAERVKALEERVKVLEGSGVKWSYTDTIKSVTRPEITTIIYGDNT